MTECVGVHQLASTYLFLTSCLATNFERSKKLKGSFSDAVPKEVRHAQQHRLDDGVHEAKLALSDVRGCSVLRDQI